MNSLCHSFKYWSPGSTKAVDSIRYNILSVKCADYCCPRKEGHKLVTVALEWYVLAEKNLVDSNNQVIVNKQSQTKMR